MKNRYRYYIITFVRRAANPKKVLCRIRLQIEISAALSGFFDDSGSNAVWKMVKGEEQMDNCMPFPNLLVRVRRCRHCILHYMDENWEEQEMHMDDDMSELIQHEYDHLDGILATMRAIDNKSFVMKKETRK